MQKKIPIIKEVDGKKKVFFYQLNETEEGIYRELQWIKELIEMEELKYRFRNTSHFDKSTKRLSALGFISIIKYQDKLLVMAN